jgi:hypothetical protein
LKRLAVVDGNDAGMFGDPLGGLLFGGELAYAGSVSDTV